MANQHDDDATDPFPPRRLHAVSAPWPERLRAEPAPLPELPDHPTPLELARAYVALAIAHQGQWPVVVEALHELHGGHLGLRATTEALQRFGEALRLSVDALHQQLAPGGPLERKVAQRAKLASTSALAEMQAKLDDLEEEITGSAIDRRTGKALTQADLELRDLRARIVEYERAENARADDKVDAKRARRNALYGLAAAVLATVLTAIIFYLWGRMQGHQVGYAEGQQPRTTVEAKP